MSTRRFFKILFRRTGPIVSTMGLFLPNYTPSNKPNINEKLELKPPSAEKLTCDYMIKQSTVDAVNSATQALTVTYAAIVTVSNDYRSKLANLISLLNETIIMNVPDSHWDRIVELRTEIKDRKDTINKLLGYVDYVQKMATAASEMSFLSGMDSISESLYRKIDDVLVHIEKEVNNNKEIEEEYLHVQRNCIAKDSLKQEDPRLDNSEID